MSQSDAALSPADAAVVERIVDETVREVAELPDRTSPDDRPEMMLVTGDELASIVRDGIEEVMALVVAARAETAAEHQLRIDASDAAAGFADRRILDMAALATAERERDQAVRQRDEWRKELLSYIHSPECPWHLNADDSECRCGLATKVAAALRAAGGGQ